MAEPRYGLFVCVFVLISLLSYCQDTKDWKPCIDKEDGVSFRYPGHWRNSPSHADRTEFEGPDGSVQISASEGDSPLTVCRGEATHHLKPYGEHPRIQRTKIQGQKACLVWPSDDQGPPFFAALVVEYPHPVVIKGDRYSQLILWADKKHIRPIIETLKFIPAADQ